MPPTPAGPISAFFMRVRARQGGRVVVRDIRQCTSGTADPHKLNENKGTGNYACRQQLQQSLFPPTYPFSPAYKNQEAKAALLTLNWGLPVSQFYLLRKNRKKSFSLTSQKR